MVKQNHKIYLEFGLLNTLILKHRYERADGFSLLVRDVTSQSIWHLGYKEADSFFLAPTLTPANTRCFIERERSGRLIRQWSPVWKYLHYSITVLLTSISLSGGFGFLNGRSQNFDDWEWGLWIWIVKKQRGWRIWIFLFCNCSMGLWRWWWYFYGSGGSWS